MYLLSTVIYCTQIVTWNIPLATGSKVWVCGQYLAGFAGSNPKGALISVCWECSVLSRTGRYVGLITCPEES